MILGKGLGVESEMNEIVTLNEWGSWFWKMNDILDVINNKQIECCVWRTKEDLNG